MGATLFCRKLRRSATAGSCPNVRHVARAFVAAGFMPAMQSPAPCSLKRGRGHKDRGYESADKSLESCDTPEPHLLDAQASFRSAPGKHPVQQSSRHKYRGKHVRDEPNHQGHGK